MEDNTKDLSDSEKLNLILAELADSRVWRTNMDAWRAEVSAFIEERSRETKPLLGQIQKEIIETRIEMRERFEKVDERFEKVDERFEKMEEQITFMREDSKYVRRTAKVMQEELFRARRVGRKSGRHRKAGNAGRETGSGLTSFADLPF